MSDELRQDTSDDFEAHRKRFGRSEDAEPPEDVGEITKDESAEDEGDEPDVEAHKKKFA